MRLSKIAKDFNVGIQTLVEFLQKKGGNSDWGPNSNVPDDMFEMLSREFNKDKSVKQASERERQERLQTRDKIKEETRQINAVNSGVTQSSLAQTPGDEKVKQQQGPKILGTIDLNALNKPASPKQQQRQQGQQRQGGNQQQNRQQGQQQRQGGNQQPHPAQKPAAPKPESKPSQQTEETKKVPWGERSRDRINDEPLPAEARNGEVFRLNKVESPQLNVVGTIDLAALNQNTRPRKKSKEERKKEREQQRHNGGEDSGRGSRRQRGAQKVDINEEISRNKARDAKGEERRNRAENNKRSKDKKKGQQARQEVNEADVQQQVKDTLARLTNKPDKKAVKYRKDKRNAAAQAAAQAEEAEAAQSKVLKLTEFVTANDLATMMNIPVVQVISTCMSLGMMVSINQRLDADTINLVAENFGFETEYVSEEVEAVLEEEADNEDQLQSRPPIITVMGHVDHG